MDDSTSYFVLCFPATGLDAGEWFCDSFTALRGGPAVTDCGSMKASILYRWFVGFGSLALVLAALSLTGCAFTESLRGDGFRELDDDWGKGFRPLSQPGSAAGVSPA